MPDAAISGGGCRQLGTLALATGLLP